MLLCFEEAIISMDSKLHICHHEEISDGTQSLYDLNGCNLCNLQVIQINKQKIKGTEDYEP